MPHPFTMLLLFLTPPLLMEHSLQRLPLGLLSMVGLWPPLISIISQRKLYPDWQRRILAFPVLMILGIGMTWNNTRAVLSGLMGERNEFRRTPKFGQAWQASGYALRSNPSAWVELLMSLYTLWGVTIAFKVAPAFVPYLGLYAFAFGWIGLWSLWESWQVRHSAAARSNAPAPL
jgi:hypothetical protein